MIVKGIIAFIAPLLGGWMMFDGSHLLIYGKFFGPEKPGPWRHRFFHRTKPIQAWRSVRGSRPALAAVPDRYSGLQVLDVVWSASYGDCQSLVSTARDFVFSNLYCLASSVQIKAPIMIENGSGYQRNISFFDLVKDSFVAGGPSFIFLRDESRQGLWFYLEAGDVSYEGRFHKEAFMTFGASCTGAIDARVKELFGKNM
jgi:hypothetical protein